MSPQSVVRGPWLDGVTDADGDVPVRYRFTDQTRGNGYFSLGGVTQAAGTPIEVTAAQLSGLWFRGAGTNRVSDTVVAEVHDGYGWSAPVTLTVQTRGPNQLPVVSGTGATVGVKATIAASSLFTVSDADDEAITAYELWDSAGGGRFLIGGVAQVSGAAIPVSAAQLASTTYEGGSAPGSETLWVGAICFEQARRASCSAQGCS